MDHCSATAFHEPHSVKQSAALNFWFVLFQDKMNREATRGNNFLLNSDPGSTIFNINLRKITHTK
jgi:hypothetical protein